MERRRRLSGWAPRVARKALLAGAWFSVLFGAMSAFMFLRQESYVFFPQRGLTATPETWGMAFEDVRLRTEDGPIIHGWFVPSRTPRGTLLLFHGNAGTLSDRVEKIRLFHGWGLNVLAVDYRGYGESEGIPSEEGTYADARAALEEALRRGAGGRLVYFGESLGGAVATELARIAPPRALVLESTFTSVPEMARRLYPWLPVSLLVRIRYDSLARIKKLTCPLAVLHSPEDEIVPYSMGRRLFEAASGPKEFIPLQGSHNEGGILHSFDAQESLESFLAKALEP
jgi:hypothetical protein